ncbi:hypothetical protein [Photorhabdus sp. RM71S]|uniref:hypothetical protein n=1 Tax=Photorhabdus sp. RM71S TaxID=3342824 RepID=UPI0036DABD51
MSDVDIHHQTGCPERHCIPAPPDDGRVPEAATPTGCHRLLSTGGVRYKIPLPA